MALTLSPGTSLYKFDLKVRIGGGNTSEVWLAHDRGIAKDVAIKVLEPSVGTISEKLKEAHYGNQLEHRNLVKVLYADVVDYGGVPLVTIAMDHHPDGSVLRRLSPGNFMYLPRAVACIIDVLRGLEYLHELGLYHGDIKPKNILCGEQGTSVLTDYGITCHSPTGKPVPYKDAYVLHIAPETIHTDSIDVLTDIYQTGMTAFRLVNGIGAVEDKYNSLGLTAFLEEVKKGKVARPQDYTSLVPRQLKTIINKAIHLDPNQRYQSAREMRRDLERLVFPGYWTINGEGRYEGRTNGHIFSFDVVSIKGTYELIAHKENRATGRKTRVPAHCKKGMTKAQFEAAQHDFVQAVIKGTC